VLARVYDPLAKARPAGGPVQVGDGPADRRSLDELRPGADDRCHLHR